MDFESEVSTKIEVKSSSWRNIVPVKEERKKNGTFAQVKDSRDTIVRNLEIEHNNGKCCIIASAASKKKNLELNSK